MHYEGPATDKFEGRDRSDLSLTDRLEECLDRFDVVKKRFARDVNEYAVDEPRDITQFRDGIIQDEHVQAVDHERLVARNKKERMLQKHQHDMAKALEGFIASQQLGLEKPAWTYTDPPGYFERSSSVGSIVDATPSENFVKNSLMGMWNTAGYRHCHADANVLRPTAPGFHANKHLTNRQAKEIYYAWLKENERMGLSGPSEANMDRDGWNYFREFGDEVFGRWKGIDVDVDSKHPRHGFLHSVEQHRLRGEKEKHYDQKTTKTVKAMKHRHHEDMLNETAGWKRRERMLKNAPDYSALAPPGRKKVDWSSQDKNGDYFEYPVYNALSDEPYNGPWKDLITVPKRTLEYGHTNFICGEIRSRAGAKDLFSDTIAPLGGTRTLAGEFWQKPDHPSTQNTLSNRVQAKFDKWNRSGKQYWAEEALRVGRRDAMLTSNEITATEAAAKKETELLAAKTFKLTEAPNRICWSMCVHAGDKQELINVEADPNWTVDELLKKLLSSGNKSGFISKQTIVAPTVNQEDAMWNLIECKSRGRSTPVERQQTLLQIGLEALQNTHLTRVGLAATSVSPMAVTHKTSESASRPKLSASNSMGSLGRKRTDGKQMTTRRASLPRLQAA